jgi:hypothetical protein
MLSVSSCAEGQSYHQSPQYSVLIKISHFISRIDQRTIKKPSRFLQSGVINRKKEPEITWSTEFIRSLEERVKSSQKCFERLCSGAQFEAPALKN